jgi:hypothetical protein
MIIRGPGAAGRTGGTTGSRGALACADAGGVTELDATGGAAGGGVAADGVGATGALAAGAAGLGAAGGMITRGGVSGAAVAEAAGLTTGAATEGLASCGGGVTGRAGGGGAATPCCLPMIAFSTSPGLEMCDRSILVLMPSGSGRAVRADLAAPSPEPRRRTRTFSASCSSRELECVFFSVTPTSVNTSRMALLLTSSSRARSLIRTLLIRLFVPPDLLSKSSCQPLEVSG